MTGTEKSDRSGGPSCEARTDRYVILNGGGWVSNAKSMAMNEAAEHLAAYGGREGPFTAHLIGPAVTFETREEKLERLVEVVLEQGQLHASWLAAELLASREATLTPEQIKRFEGGSCSGGTEVTDLSDLVAEGRRLHEFARMADAFPQRVTTGADLGVWSRNNLPALLDEAEKVPTLEAEVIHLANARQLLNAMLDQREAEIARLRADRDRCKAAAISIEHDVCHIIGEALYGPDGWGDHVAQTLAQKAVNEIARLREALA